MENIEQFGRLLEAQQIKRLRADNLACDANVHNARVSIKPGKKYTKVNVGDSGKYMVDANGDIWGIKAYGVIHKGHHFGTLDTINEWYWGRYRAFKKQVA